ncbi:UDP-glucose dehydrogenase family protein [Burkholderia multivorans]|uniref:UDP-glucose dehydrogenase family protein n=1 Tax=Burkholderia multivorans TaxID=87883 RepID=UPI000D00831B|nr:UDP-glucose/GDP-mannose dehydrogenase family protein [Burkholderia multivorans]PRG23313.1 UDP-glucose 6-dehydrogenase [Burkholderia multivorans]
MNVRIAIVGTGYVGLVSGACLAELGHDVVCIDNNRGKIDALNQGCMPIYEPGLDAFVARNVGRGTLRFSCDLAASVRDRDAVFIAVGTPTLPGTDRADLQYVEAAARDIASNLNGFTVVVTKSTVPVGTNRRVQGIVERHAPPGIDTAIASNPEFLREGSAIDDFMHPDRVVFGAEHPRAIEIMNAIYAPLAAAGHLVLATEIETAELVKYAANAFLAVKISYINEISDLCEAVGADVELVANGMGLDRRIGAAFLRAGPGWGGSCFPKDTRALKATASEHAVPLRIVSAAIESNALRKAQILQRIENACGGSIKGKRIAVLGLTFKGQTDDVRESPSIDVIQLLVGAGAHIRAYDPARPHEASRLLPQVFMESSAVDAVRSADAVVVMTEWKAFETLDLADLADHMSDPVMLDMRNLFDERRAADCGFRRYERVGRSCTARTPADAARGRVPVADDTTAAPQPASKLMIDSN